MIKTVGARDEQLRLQSELDAIAPPREFRLPRMGVACSCGPIAVESAPFPRQRSRGSRASHDDDRYKRWR